MLRVGIGAVEDMAVYSPSLGSGHDCAFVAAIVPGENGGYRG